MTLQPPFTALLRCRMFGQVRERVADSSTCFDLLGNVQGEWAPELWRADGRWLENGQPHALDIVGIVIGRDSEGVAQIEPYGPAAGKAKDLTPKPSPKGKS